MKLPSGSSLERAKHCPGSFHGQQVGSTSEASKKGTENHEKVELSLDKNDLSNVPERCRPLIGDRMARGELPETEVAYAIDVVTGDARVLGKKLGRNYPPTGPNEIKLTVDLVMSGLVLDWKSRTRVTAARDNLQIRAAVYAAWKTQGESSDFVGGLAYLADGFTDLADFDVFSMHATLEELRAIVAGIRNWAEGDELHEGEWCTYCPRFTNCAPKRAMLENMAATLHFIGGMVDDGLVGAAYEKLKLAKKALERVEQTIKDAVQNAERFQETPVVLASGKRLVMVAESRTSLDQDAVKEKYAQMGVAIPMKTTSFYKMAERVNR